MPYFSDYQHELPSIITIVNIAITAFHKINPIEINTQLGPISGKTSKDILSICLSIINYVRYININLTFSCLIEIDNLSLNVADKVKQLNKAFSNLINYNLQVLGKYGFYVQSLVLDILEYIDIHSLTVSKERFAYIGKCILASDIEGWMVNNYKSALITQESMLGNEQVSDLRERMLTLLFNQKNQMILKALNFN